MRYMTHIQLNTVTKSWLAMIKPNKEEHAILVFPNDTRVEMHGDLDIIKKVIARLDGLEISYATDPNTEVTSSDTNKPNILNDKLLDLASEFKKLLPSEYWKPLYYGAQIPKILELIATKEAASIYDQVMMQLYGDNVFTNFDWS